MITITLYSNFSKRINSTKQPTSGTQITAVLKAPTSIENPTFVIDGVNTNINYVKWGDHYYFVSDLVIVNNNMIELRCSQDLLATYKTEIGSTSAYVEYCASASNSLIADQRLTMSDDILITTNKTSAIATATDGTYIITIAGSGLAGTIGFTTMYAMNGENIRRLQQYLYDDSIVGTILKSFNNPYEALIECHFVPWQVVTDGVYGDLVEVGNEIVEYPAQSGNFVYARGLGSESKTYTSTSIAIPWNYNDWRDFDPYSKLQLYLPFYGIVELDASKFKGQTTIDINYKFDPLSGEVSYNVICGAWSNIYRTDASVSISIGQTTGKKPQGIAQIGGGAGAIAGAVMTGGSTAPLLVAGGLASIGAGAMTYFQSDSTAKGGQGGFGNAFQILGTPATSDLRKICLTMYSHKFGTSSPNNVNAVMGKPLFEVRTINTLSGFVKCAGASVTIDGLGDDREVINSYLNGSGIYYE